MAKLIKCLVCRPKVFSTEGVDHTGRDFYLKCSKCGTRTTCRVEANYAGDADAILRQEWRKGHLTDLLGRLALTPSDQGGER